MKKWVTEIKALDPKTGEMKSWSGPEVQGISAMDAEQYCQNNGLGYCKVIGELVVEIPCEKGTYKPDFENMTDYEQPTMN